MVGVLMKQSVQSRPTLRHRHPRQQFTKLSALFVAKGVQRCLFRCQSIKAHRAEIDQFAKMVHKDCVDVLEVKDTQFRTVANKDDIDLIPSVVTKKLALALAALCGVIGYEGLQKDGHCYTLCECKMEFMRLGSSAVSALVWLPLHRTFTHPLLLQKLFPKM